MGSNWSSIRLGEVCTKIGSGATPRGGSDVYLETGPFALIRSQNVYNDGFHHDGLAYVGERHAAELAGVAVLPHDVLLNITGDSVARTCQVDPKILPARVNQHVAIIRPDSERLDPRFLRYFLVSPEMQAKLLSWAGSGGTRNALTKGMIEGFEIPAPENIFEQRAIAHILGTLDDKIEVNRRMSATLEAIVRALFKSWFVDFDPVRARIEGCDPGLAPHVAALFPDRLIETEHGEIPEGWEQTTLADIAEFLNGLALQRYPASDLVDSLPVIKIAELRNGVSAKTDRASRDVPAKYIVNDGDFLFSWSGSLLAKFWTEGEGALNQHLFKVTSDRYPAWFFSEWVHVHLEEFQRIAAFKATTMGHIQRSHLQAAVTNCPPDNVIAGLGVVIEPMVERRIRNELDTRTLAALRDALLPKLISGALRLKDPETFLERVPCGRRRDHALCYAWRSRRYGGWTRSH